MTYSPVNIDAYTNAYSGAIAGMAISGWIVDPTSADYSNVAAIAGAFAQAFDLVWNNATGLNWLQIQSIQSVSQEQFTGHAPGSLDNSTFAQASNWAVPAAACAALVLRGDAFVASEGITPNTPGSGGGGGDPIFRQVWLDTTKPDGGNGAIGSPYNTWANAVAPLEASGGSQPWVINLAQLIDASGTPIPNIGADGHNTGRVSLKGPIAASTWTSFENSNTVVTGLVIDPQDGGDFALDVADLTIIGVSVPPSSLILTAQNAILSSFSEASTSVFGTSSLINCSLTSFILPSFNLRMQGGTVDSSIEVDNGYLDSVEFLSSADFRFGTTLNLTNCRFQPGAVIQCSASQTLNVDSDTWGAMVAAGVTFPDTAPTVVIVPQLPGDTVLGTVPIMAANTFADVDLVTTLAKAGGVYAATINDTGMFPRIATLGIMLAFCDVDGTLKVRVFGTNGGSTSQSFSVIRLYPPLTIP
jgi:hypothetical protein